MSFTGTADHAVLMDGVYRYQRHFYDLTRKYYLLGRDRLIEKLDAPDGGSVLEIGCGTGRNLVLAARRYQRCRLYGLDISAEMLATARKAMTANYVDRQVELARGDAAAFEAEALFGRAQFDRVYLSYALSMIPHWEKAIEQALATLAPGGSLHVVDFGQQERLPRWFRNALRIWLRKFHVEPRATLIAELAACAEARGARLSFEPLYRDYAWHAVLTMPAAGGGQSSAPTSASTIA